MKELGQGWFALGVMFGIFGAIFGFLALGWFGVVDAPAKDFVSAVSGTVALVALLLAFLTFRAGLKKVEGEFLFQSEREYAKLFIEIEAVGNWVKVPANREFFDDMVPDRLPDDVAAMQEKALKFEAIWPKIRPIKSFFRSIQKFHAAGVISRDVAKAAINQAAYDLLARDIRKMDAIRFCHTWRDNREKLTPDNFISTHSWYDDLAALANNP